ncbi:MAG: hypothetical protein K5656_10880 [Lachnospiraceae bacterium]|nr:hypothetical protein [Lachnospiraceae bacterium]
MITRMGLYHKFSMFILFFAIIASICCVATIGINIKNSIGYKDCKITAQGSLSSCVSQEDGNKTYYFGVYKFVYNNLTWHFMNNTYYTSEDKVPAAVTIVHNAFTSNDDMKARVKYDRTFSLPFIYGAIAIFLFLLFSVFWGNYKDEKAIALAKANANKGNSVELDEILNDNNPEDEDLSFDNYNDELTDNDPNGSSEFP